MAEIQHRDIPDNQLHEPKGAVSASADTVYIADGAGSGSWKSVKVQGADSAQSGMIIKALGGGDVTWVYPPQGWGHYVHSGANQTFDSSYKKLMVNGAGGASNSAYLPLAIRGTGTELWDTTESKMTPMEIGDSYALRIDIPIISTTGTVTDSGTDPVSDITVQFDVGGLSTPSNVIAEGYGKAAKTTPYILSISFPLFSLDSFKSNGGQIFIKAAGGTITTDAPKVTVTRLSGGDS